MHAANEEIEAKHYPVNKTEGFDFINTDLQSRRPPFQAKKIFLYGTIFIGRTNRPANITA